MGVARPVRVVPTGAYALGRLPRPDEPEPEDLLAGASTFPWWQTTGLREQAPECIGRPMPTFARGVRVSAAVLLSAGLFAACGAESSTTTSDSTAAAIGNCGREITVVEPPERVMAFNSAAVENLLALGLEDRIVAADGSRDSIRPELREKFDELEIFETGEADYPSAEVVLEGEPEFVYSAYRSAFGASGGMQSRDEFEELGVQTYLSPAACPDFEKAGEPLAFEDHWGELRELGSLLGVEDRAQELVAEQRAAIEEVRESLPETEPLEVFWWDIGTNEPWGGLCCGAPGMIMRELGLENVFDDVEGDWDDVSWEQVIERDPDMIVMADFGDGDIAEKREFIADDETLSLLRPFQEDRVVVLPFSQTTPGLQNVEAIETIAASLRDWDAEG